MDDNHLSNPTECINASHFSDQNYANPIDLMNLHSTSMPSPVPAPNLNYIPTSIPFANQDTEIYPSNNNYANERSKHSAIVQNGLTRFSCLCFSQTVKSLLKGYPPLFILISRCLQAILKPFGKS